LGEGEWKTKKHGADYRCQWRKVPLGIDATRAIEVAENATGDAPMLPCLLDLRKRKMARLTASWRMLAQTPN
jgi:hypothetical protein